MTSAISRDGKALARPQHQVIAWRTDDIGFQRVAIATDQAHCTVAAVARQCGLSRGHFSMAFKAWTGYSPAQWRLARKIDMAKLLLKGTLSIADIAIECGFADQAHLTRSFRAAEGLSPGQWRSQFRAH